MQKDIVQYKVALYRILIAPFNNPEGMDLLINEIKIFNKGLNPISKLYQLTLADKRQIQLAGFIIIAFTTEQEANKAIKNKLYIANISVRVKKAYFTALSTQCSKCQGFGHLDTYCRKSPNCKFCEENHHSS